MSASVKALAALLLLAAAGACADVIAQTGRDAGPGLTAEQATGRNIDPGDPGITLNDPSAGDTLIGRVGLRASAERPTSTAPRLTPERSHLVGADTPLTLGTDGRPLTELGGVSYRWWLSRGRADVGVGVGALGRVITPPPGVVDGGTSLSGSIPTVTLGWRYRVTPDSVVFADASGARGLGFNGNGNFVNTKLGAEWKSPASRFGLDKRGHLGIRFDSGYRMSLRVRKSGVGVYLRGQF